MSTRSSRRHSFWNSRLKTPVLLDDNTNPIPGSTKSTKSAPQSITGRLSVSKRKAAQPKNEFNTMTLAKGGLVDYSSEWEAPEDDEGAVKQAETMPPRSERSTTHLTDTDPYGITTAPLTPWSQRATPETRKRIGTVYPAAIKIQFPVRIVSDRSSEQGTVDDLLGAVETIDTLNGAATHLKQLMSPEPSQVTAITRLSETNLKAHNSSSSKPVRQLADLMSTGSSPVPFSDEYSSGESTQPQDSDTAVPSPPHTQQRASDHTPAKPYIPLLPASPTTTLLPALPTSINRNPPHPPSHHSLTPLAWIPHTALHTLSFGALLTLQTLELQTALTYLRTAPILNPPPAVSDVLNHLPGQFDIHGQTIDSYFNKAAKSPTDAQGLQIRRDMARVWWDRLEKGREEFVGVVGERTRAAMVVGAWGRWGAGIVGSEAESEEDGDEEDSGIKIRWYKGFVEKCGEGEWSEDALEVLKVLAEGHAAKWLAGKLMSINVMESY